MILKVRSELNGENGWLVLGEVTDVSWSDKLVEMTYDKLLDMGSIGDYLVFDNPIPEWDKESDQPEYNANDVKQKCKIIMALGRDGKNITVYFNDVTYLMNDDGKTVETIYGY